MNCTPEINQLAGALAKAQGAYLPLKKDRTVKVPLKDRDGNFTGKSYTFKYATHDAIFDATRKALSDNGLCITQPPTNGNHGIIVATRLMHESGQWIEESLEFSTAAVKPQDLGSLITYGKRYLLAGLLGIAADEDDDGNAANGTPERELAPEKTPPPVDTDKGRKRTAKPTPEQMNKDLGEHFADPVDPSQAIMARAREVISVAVGEIQYERCEQSILEHVNAGHIDAMQCAELSSLLAKRRQAERDANELLETAAAAT